MPAPPARGRVPLGRPSAPAAVEDREVQIRRPDDRADQVARVSRSRRSLTRSRLRAEQTIRYRLALSISIAPGDVQEDLLEVRPGRRQVGARRELGHRAVGDLLARGP